MPGELFKKEKKSFGHAFNGIAAAFKSEFHIKIHLVFLMLVVIFGFLFQISITEWLICVVCFAMVIGAELINTAIEAVVDIASPEIHPLAAKAKDVAAGAVLVISIFSAIIGLIIFVPKIWEVLKW